MTFQQTIDMDVHQKKIEKAVARYGSVLARMTADLPFADDLKAAHQEILAAGAGETEVMAALRRHLASDLERLADGPRLLRV